MLSLLGLFAGELAVGGTAGVILAAIKNPGANTVLKTFGGFLVKRMNRPLTPKEKELVKDFKKRQTLSDLVHGYR